MLVVFGACLAPSASGQSTDQAEELRRLAVQLKASSMEARARAESLALRTGMPIRTVYEDGGIIELQRIENGMPVYYMTENLNAARSVSSDKVWPGGSGGMSLTGSGITLGVWDGGKVRETHQEFETRVVLSDDASSNSQHSTHVAGTMVAGGVDAGAKGMSYQATLNSYDWNDDESEMTFAGLAGLRASNHSYTIITGWYYNYFSDSRWAWFGDTTVSNTQDYKFGFYNSQSQQWDNIAFNAPNYLIVKSAGNDRNDAPSSQPVQHWVNINSQWVLRTVTRDPDGGTTGYDCLAHSGVSKNILSVGSVNDIPGGYTAPGDVVMTSYSCWGPVDDGRIKPDIVANGQSLRSANSSSNTSYVNLSGTSMAAPNVTGSLGLLLQQQNLLYGGLVFRASTLKGLVIHTADEAGSNPGPDYVFGWGLMNTLKAAQVMATDAAQGGNRNIRELTLLQGQTIDVNVYSDGDQPLRATISWTDPAGTPTSPSLNPTTPMLVNNVDLRILGNSTTYLPWGLNPASPSTAATTADNNRDNVEQVLVGSPSPGIYTVRVSHKGTLTGGLQRVSLIITGGSFGGTMIVSSPNGGEVWSNGTTRAITWSSFGFPGNVAVELSTNGGTSFSTIIANIANDGTENWVVNGTPTSLARIRVVSVDSPSVADTSNGNFTIVQPSITVGQPNGGQEWPIGNQQTIQWGSQHVTGNVSVHLSRDGGATFSEVLFSNTANDGTENWVVTGPATSQALVRITSLSISGVADTSDSVFAIVQPTVSVLSPSGSETWYVGSSQEVSWTSDYVSGDVRVELSRDGGATFPELLFGPVPSTGSGIWMATGPGTSSARIRVVSAANPAVADTSTGTIEIINATVSVVSPDGGELWLVGVPQTIAWSSSNLPGNVNVELSRDGGVSYTTLFANIPDTGEVHWIATLPPTSQAVLRVASADHGFIRDSSNSVFVIADGVQAQMNNGWNLVSVPVDVADRRRSSAFPTSVSFAYTFTPSGYSVRDTLVHGSGYWLKFGSNQTITMAGGLRESDTVIVSPGWNLIGSISYDVSVDSIIQIPSGIVGSAYFGFQSGLYSSTSSIAPMRGYWVKILQPGVLVLRNGSVILRPERIDTKEND